MSDRAEVAMTWIERLVREEIEKHELFIATATAVSDGKVAITRIGAVTQDKYYGRLAGADIAVDDLVVMQRLGSEFIVLGKLQNTEGGGSFLPLSGGTLTGALEIAFNDDAAFVVTDGLGTAGTNARLVADVVNFSGAGALNFANGMRARGYSDAFSTNTWEFDSANGAITGQSFNSPVFELEVQDTPTDSTNTSNSVWDTNVEASITLPTGTWTIYAITVGGYTNASIASVRQRTRIGASSAGSSWQMLCDSGLPVTFVTAHSLTGQTGTVTCYGQYQPVTNGQTVTAKGGMVFIMARRTA